MKRQNQLGMLCGYFLSRLDEEAYRYLGLGNVGQTHEKLGEILGVKATSIKGWRDEFDPVHSNSRVGWIRKQNPTRVRVLEALECMPDLELCQLIDALLANPEGYIANFVLALIEEDESTEAENVVPSNRQQTGKRAEELFLLFHESHGQPVPGELEDRRTDMCGYDFGIAAASRTIALEIKGLATSPSRFDLSLTGKEWRVAQDMRMDYFLVAVCDVYGEPEFVFIQDPASHLDAREYVYSTPTLTWRANVERARFDVVPFQP